MIRRLFFLTAVALCVTSCVTPDTRHHVVVSIPEQRLALLDNGVLMATFPVSTSKFTIGDSPGSNSNRIARGEFFALCRLTHARIE